MIPSPSPVFQFFKTDGKPAAGYFLHTYLAGTTTDADTYQDSGGSTLHTNPIELDVNGCASIFINPSVAYKYVLTTAAGATVDTWDNIQVYNPVSGLNYDQETVNISSGAATITKTMVLVDTEAAAATDDLVTLNKTGGVTGDVVYISAASSQRPVVVKHGTSTNNISTKSLADYTLTAGRWMMLRYNGTSWVEVEMAVNPASSPNLIINGRMRVDQRNVGAAQTITAGAAKAYTVDRFFAYCTGANVTGQQIAGSTAGTYRYQFTGATSNTGIGFGTRLEACNTAHLAGKSASLQVKLKSSSITTVTWTASYADTADTFGTIASPTKTQIATGTFTITPIEAVYSTTIQIPSAATTGIEILFTCGALVSAQTLVYGDVKLEDGPVSTGFENDQTQIEDELCRRYYEKSYRMSAALGSSNAVNYYESSSFTTYLLNASTVQFCVEKRDTPVISLYAYSNGTSSSCSEYDTSSLFVAVRGVTASQIGTRNFHVNGSDGNFTTGALQRFHWTADCEL